MINRIKSKPELKGYLALVLHAHLPYIRHQHRHDQLEEHWFYAAMTETYLPLLEVFERLTLDKIDFRLTLSLSPTLLSLFSDTLMRERYHKHLSRLIELAGKEQQRLRKDPQLLPLAVRYQNRFIELQTLFEKCEGNLVGQFKHYQEKGVIEIITSAASYGYLPYMKTEEAIQAQIATAVRDYERHFQCSPKGIWLPECGYTPGIDRIMKPYGIEYCFSDSTAVAYASPRPNREQYAPLMTPYGVSVFPADPESSSQVWSTVHGYPGDYHYREYYKDIGWDLGSDNAEEWSYIRPYVLPDQNRVNTGIKYYRITGKGSHNEPYEPESALQKAAGHAGHFLHNRQSQIEYWRRNLDRKPIINIPFDAELLGHWWYEGPIWLETLCRQIFTEQHTLKMITPSEYLREYPVADVGIVTESSWCRNEASKAPLQGNHDELYRHLHQAEERMIQLSTRYEHLSIKQVMNTSQLIRALNQAGRELLLAQSGDWAFIVDNPAAAEHAVNRCKEHLGCFHLLCDQIDRTLIDEQQLADLEQQDDCFPAIDYRDYAAIVRHSPNHIVPELEHWQKLLEETKDSPNVFMLTWEYPPKHVGGLSRSVHELSEALAAEGQIVHVITTSHFGAPYFEQKNGVFVHRLPIQTSGDTSFYHWSFEMNLAMVDYLVRWKESGGRIDLLHAHDWMVMQASREIKQSYHIPLIATLHATEWGRNQGQIHTQLQHKIHQMEWQLTYEADQVFVCSEYMRNQVHDLFSLPAQKVQVFPNGVGLAETKPSPARPDFLQAEDRMIFCIGRLVYEKGIQVLIAAMPAILSQIPQAKLVIAGSGPMEQQLRDQASHLGDRVYFAGFVGDEYRAALYQASDVCVIPSLYEPFGIVVLEAMASLKPVVIADTGGLAEIIEHGIDGYKALPGNVESLAWHITDLLLQPSLGDQLATAAYLKLVRNYQWNWIAKEIRKQYDKLTYTSKEMIEA
ncbi:1,4-alpha-glucan branching protein domain-containing protein [Paenibacillus eucommiae]|uniref:1,4-alpha-glucan branching enzyme n=1 Tax=Paenibacillus eucommiae TaxID=1355755 RepID=A0ABS4J176_9BACL|nr:1,4-alpha-glucan branching protein domain-containing protein [Paenibacillus eucommiae]MBP1993575.1 1,4-alpha-glucan branching enzyme [Paenibacillus eucommiae]